MDDADLRDLADRLHLVRSGRSWRGTCPACAYPRAFSLRPGKTAPLIFCANGCRHADLRVALADAGAPSQPSRPPPNAGTAGRRRQGAALRLVEAGLPALGTLADRYLTFRGLPGLAASSALRFIAQTPHPDGMRLPPLVALVTNTDGRTVAIHRTYLASDGKGKAAVEPSRASLGPVWGAAIRLAEPNEAGELLIGEGIETAASAGRMLGLPAWASISAGNLARGLVLPPAINSVVIAVDPDPPGEAAAQTAADRWLAAGLRVRLARPTGHADFNDLLRAQVVANAR